MLESSLTGVAFCLFMNSITLCKGRNAGSFLRWQSCIGLPSRAKLALRRAAMEQHYHSYARTPFASSRRSPRWEASHVIFGSLLLSNKSRSLATSRVMPLSQGRFSFKEQIVPRTWQSNSLFSSYFLRIFCTLNLLLEIKIF